MIHRSETLVKSIVLKLGSNPSHPTAESLKIKGNQ